jgi:predicted NAD/FAD-binding protein
LVDSEGEEGIFDKVVVCTQPQDAQRLVAACHPELAKLLGRIHHDRSETILHTDDSLMPADRANWCVSAGTCTT